MKLEHEKEQAKGRTPGVSPPPKFLRCHLGLFWFCGFDGEVAFMSSHMYLGNDLISQRFPVAQRVKNLLQCGRSRFNPWLGEIPWKRERQPLQYSCLENPMDRAWRATVHGITEIGHDWHFHFLLPPGFGGPSIRQTKSLDLESGGLSLPTGLVTASVGCREDLHSVSCLCEPL